MNVIAHLRSMTRPFLKGHLHKLWLCFKTARFADKFARLLATYSVNNFSEPSHAIRPRKEQLRRILFVCDNMWERRELLPELNKIAQVDFVDTREFRANKGKEEAPIDLDDFARSLAASKQKIYDLIIVYLRSSLLSQALLNYLRETWRAPLVGLNLDDKTNFEHLELFRRAEAAYREWAKYFDCNLSNSKSMVDLYHANGFPCLYLPTGFHFDPARARVARRNEFRYETTFVGSCKPERAEFIERMEQLGMRVTVFGSGWKNAQFINDGWKIYATSQINLGFGYNVNGKQITNLKNRDFECPGAGGCYLTTFDWELAELFRVGQEILCYRDLYDLAEVWSFYIRRPERCREIANAGQQRAIKEHTWEQRFRAIMSKLGFEA